MFKFIPDPGRRKVGAFAALTAAFFVALIVAGSLPAQQPSQGFPFRATNYEVEVLLHPDDQTISGLAKVEFIAQQVSRTVVVELHQDLKINSVNVPGGKPLEFERDNNLADAADDWACPMRWPQVNPFRWCSIIRGRYRAKTIARRRACGLRRWIRPRRICCCRRAGFR